jgi:hypothetical protein
VHHLAREELGNREPDDVEGLFDVADDASHLCAGQAVRFGAEAEHDLVTVNGVDIEVDSDPRTAGGGEPLKKRPARAAQLFGTE